MNEPKPHESLSRGGDVVGLGAARGKAGRANTATDPAPTEMFETVINLRPEAEWRAGMTTNKLIAELDQALQFPGVPTPGRCRSRRASTCCPPVSAHRSASS
jgi:hypothetical protein